MKWYGEASSRHVSPHAFTMRIVCEQWQKEGRCLGICSHPTRYCLSPHSFLLSWVYFILQHLGVNPTAGSSLSSSEPLIPSLPQTCPIPWLLCQPGSVPALASLQVEAEAKLFVVAFLQLLYPEVAYACLHSKHRPFIIASASMNKINHHLCGTRTINGCHILCYT